MFLKNSRYLLGLVIICCGIYAQEKNEIPLPIVFDPNYGISFFKIEKLHPFDTNKYLKIATHLQKVFNIKSTDFQKPAPVTDKQLLMVLSGGYSKESAPAVSKSIENIIKKFKLIAQRASVLPKKIK